MYTAACHNEQHIASASLQSLLDSLCFLKRQREPENMTKTFSTPAKRVVLSLHLLKCTKKHREADQPRQLEHSACRHHPLFSHFLFTISPMPSPFLSDTYLRPGHSNLETFEIVEFRSSLLNEQLAAPTTGLPLLLDIYKHKPNVATYGLG